MRDLFSDDSSLNALQMQDAETYYLEKFLLKEAPAMIMRRLISETPWRAENVVVWGKTYAQPRLIAWHGEPGNNYTYSGISLNPLPWTETLLELKLRVEGVVDEKFNSVLLNYYRDNRDSMGFHSDDEKELGTRPIIASISLGEERTFVLKHKKNKAIAPFRLKLASGSLLVMKGETQRNWKHGIAKESRPCGPRVNLTFRRIQM